MKSSSVHNYVLLVCLCIFVFSCKLKEGDEIVSARRFYGKNLSFFELPSTIKQIEESAFENNNLTEIVFPQSITYIGSKAFANNKLQKVEIPEGVTEIGSYAFSDNQIDEIILPKSLLKINNNAFSNNKLQKVEIPEGVIEIGSNAFSNNQITELIVPISVKNIGSSAFENNQLTVYPIQTNEITLGGRAFAKNLITEIRLKPGVNFSWNTFAENKISRFVLSEGYKDIGGAPNNDITAFTIPVSAETIVSHAFENNQIARLSIPGNVKTIGAYSFSGNKLTSLRIPKNVESIEGYAFADNPLEWVTIDNKSIKIGATSFPPKIMNSLTKQLASTIGYDDLAREMNKWQGKTVKISGRISQINDPETSQPKIYLDLSGDWDFSLEWDYKKIFVRYRYEDNEVRFLENDRVTIWGTVTGISEHRSNLDILGRATSKLPEINARIIERQKTGGL